MQNFQPPSRSPGEHRQYPVGSSAGLAYRRNSPRARINRQVLFDADPLPVQTGSIPSRSDSRRIEDAAGLHRLRSLLDKCHHCKRTLHYGRQLVACTTLLNCSIGTDAKPVSLPSAPRKGQAPASPSPSASQAAKLSILGETKCIASRLTKFPKQ